MNTEDVGKLSTAELDALIAVAVKERTKRPDPHPLQPPKEFEATVNPAWFVFLVGESTIIQFRHAGHGWVSIAIPPPERAHLASLLMHHSLLGNITKAGEQKPDAAPPVPPGQGGGTVH